MDFKKKLNTLLKTLSQLLPDLLVIIGSFFITFATFKLSIIAGYYCMGGILLILGLFLAKAR
jgi:hypothetical protein